ncbi:MAG: hypothetical protein G8237_12480 [Magnetococcales bacterium]|nr:nitrate- and nitrite sensing domain-containing protein [Magnetococcales bacterium]NGZ07159.1 hypothetical protein [Magnetococcales bacterium]
MRYLESLPFRVKLMLIWLVPMIGVFWFVLFGVFEKLTLIENMELVNKISHLTEQTSLLIHEIQKERGMSSGFLGSGGHDFSEELLSQRELTDEKYQTFYNLLFKLQEDHAYSGIHDYYQTITADFNHTAWIRTQTDQHTIPFDDVIDFYSNLINRLLKIFNLLSDLSPTVHIANLIYNYHIFLHGKELAGMERAMIVNMLASQRFGPGMYRRYKETVAEQEALFKMFRTMAEDEIRHVYDAAMQDGSIAQVEQMRGQIFNRGYDSSLYALLGQMYQHMGLRGIYHSVKNLLIRGSHYGDSEALLDPHEQQEHYKEQFYTHYNNIINIVKQIQELPTDELVAEQRRDVNLILENVEAYRQSVDVIIALQNQGKRLHEIDQDRAAGVKIDDLPADAAMRRLVASSLAGSFNIDPHRWFQAITAKINQLQKVDRFLSRDLVQHGKELNRQAWEGFFGYLVFCLLVVLVSLGFGLFMVQQLRNKTKRMIDLHRKISHGDYSARIRLTDENAQDELDLLALSMNDMLDSLETVMQQREQLLHSLDAKVTERTQELIAKIRELKATRNELIASEKMAALGRLVAGIAHEINTPVGVAYAATTQMGEECLAMQRMFQQDEVDVDALLASITIVDEASKLIARNLERAAELIQSFKRASSDQSSEAIRDFRVVEVVRDVQLSLRHLFKKSQIEIRLECPEGLWLAGAPGHLQQILTNLLLNSLIHGFAEGTRSGTIMIRIALYRQNLELIYSDDGAGMTEEVRTQAFEPFFTTNRRAGGSGLGLYICYNLIVSQLRGSVMLTSVPERGVCFICRWPVVVKREGGMSP